MRAKSLTLVIALVLTGALATFIVGVDRVGANSEPDLAIKSLTVSDSVPRPGETIRLVATVRNRGDVRSSNTRLRYYRSTELSVSSLDVKIDENVLSGLAPSGEVFNPIEVRAPTSAGRYYYVACVNSVSGEVNSANNCSERIPVDVADAGSDSTDSSANDVQVQHTCFTLVRANTSGDQVKRGSPTLLRRFLLASEVKNVTGSTLKDVYVEFEVANPNRGISRKHESERVDIAAGRTTTIDPKKAYVVGFPNSTWIATCTVKEDRRWPRSDVVLESERVSFTFGTYPPPHISPNVARGKLESCGPSHGSSYEVGQKITVVVDPFARLSQSVQYNAHYVGTIYKDGKEVWDGRKGDNEAIILRRIIGTFVPSSPGEYTLDCVMYIEHRYNYEPIQAFLTSAMPCMKSLGLASICTVLVINVDAALGAFDTQREIWSISNTFHVTPTGEVVSNPPDLVVDSPSASDSSRDTGETFTLSATVRNSGDSASYTTRLRYYRSTDATITTDDAEVGTSSLVDILDVQESSRESTIVTVDGPTGAYYYGACVVSLVEESNIDNNCSAGQRVTVTQPVQTSPDLVVESPSASDSELLTGASFMLRATVRNSGDGSSASTTLRYYRSTDSTITTDDTQIADDGVNSLDPSETDDEKEKLTARDAGNYYYGACVVSVSDESNTGNNCSSGVMVKVTQASPDLEVDAPSVSDASLEIGESFTLSVTVRNQGNGTSAATTLRYYRSTDSAISADDTEVGTDNVGSISLSGTDAATIDLTTPASAGTYYYGACVDSVTDESNTENNCSSGVAVTVAASQNSPDLVVSLSVNDAAPETGESFTLSATVRNQGDGTSAATILRHYSSTDSIISTDDTVLGSGVVAGIGPSEAAGAAIDRTAPATAGTYYYGACVDAVPGESNTENNCSPAVTVTVSQGSDGPVTPGNPDLVVDSPVLGVPDPPGILATGGSFLLLTTVRNQGSGTSAATTLRYYRSADSTISTDDTEEGTANVSALDASGTEGQTIDLTAPATAGTYYYGACVDAVASESNTQNNCSGAVTATVVEPTETELDLSVSSPSVSRSEVGPGGRFSLYVTVGITGVDEPFYTFPLSYHRSGDSTISDSDTVVGSETSALEPPSYSDRTGIILYAADDVGVSYYGACINYSYPDETNTQNNCSAGVAVTVTESIQTNQDLAISGSPTVTDSNPAPGGSFTLSVAVHNAGNAATPGTTYRYYRSSDSTITSGDTEVGTNTLNRLYPGQSDSGNIALTAPSVAGTYYYGACVDSVPRESDTTNNCSPGVQVTVAASTGPDLEVGGESVDDNEVEPGGTFTLEVTVSNSGYGASPSTTLRYYRSTDATISTSDTEVGTDTVSALDPDEEEEDDVTVTAPSDAGTYYYGACVDSVARESDTTNNCSSGVQVTVSAPTSPDLEIRRESVSDHEVDPGDSFTLEVTVENTGDGASPATTLRYYRSTDSTITTSDTEVDTDTVSALDPSDDDEERASLTAPSTAGVYYYGACVDAVAGESDTTNNCSDAEVVYVGGSPDLQATVSGGDLTVPTGDSFSITIHIDNEGLRTASSSTLRLYESSDSSISSTDRQVTTTSVPSIGPGSGRFYTFTLTASSTVGTYYYGGCVDSVSGESSTTNNCSSGKKVTFQ